MAAHSSTAAMAFAAVLRAEAGRRGLNQSAVAARAGIHPNTISNYWHGKRVPTLEAVFAIEDALDLDPGRLVALAHAERDRLAVAEEDERPPAPVLGEGRFAGLGVTADIPEHVAAQITKRSISEEQETWDSP